MDKEGLIKMGATGVAVAELVGATAVQIASSVGINRALDGQGLDGLGNLLQRATATGVIDSGPAEILNQMITTARMSPDAIQQAVANCEALRQSLETSPLGNAITVSCNTTQNLAESSFKAALRGLETEMQNWSEHSLGGLRMAGVMGLASIFLNRYLTERWNEVLDNEFYAFIAAQGTLVLGSAAVNAFILAPLSKLSWSSGELWRDIGVGIGMATVTILGEIVSRRLVNLEDMGPSIGVVGIALLKTKGTIQGAITLFRLLG